ncbi:HTH-type transcriptional regulator AcrR [Pseudovibrio sp. W64]|uniref:TetR/AcrR family transcriptional regulator n=1 Tax=unclassified Pseudovibrio TaxID=2627060 RepID=UPI00070EC21D|nr:MULTISPECIES: TetR/AcrR family transcriptional regulator [unclassified Pseudovibrio]KZK76356.1 HTH-type transcriptional regulator AcrR [Pseudovibrio sp. W64]KZK79998.1 HTH-type transcriptional regulator AcrR [Pseudovibrio sp. Ad46]KZK82200.1 HTH-type transcriptional regulator AcrR [Pseudovibrio sp. Ad13]KZK96402.1 HTH-type transcriptional regulator AcrR [Pseudovibrio sp. Ad5]KZL02838.1 HTH-type transcriptional regulator AcrR [Pseudovibrio sp. W74]
MLQGKQKRAQETRQRILVAATSLFNEGNFNAVSTESIAEQANVSKGTLFAHFGDKLGLFAEIGLKELKACVDSLHKAAESSPLNGRDVLNQSLMGILEYFEKQPEFLRIFIDVAGWEKGTRAENFINVAISIDALFQASVEKGQQDKSIRAIDPKLGAVSVRAFMIHVAIGRVCGEYKDTQQQHTEVQKLLSLVL